MVPAQAPVAAPRSIDTDEHRHEVGPDESPSEAVLTAVVQATDRPATPLETADAESGRDPLPPLFETVDPDALDSLVDSQDDQGNCLVTFTYAGCTVSVEERTVTVSTQT